MIRFLPVFLLAATAACQKPSQLEEHEALVRRKQQAIAVRRLTPEEIGVIGESVPDPVGPLRACFGNGCMDAIRCNDVATRTGELIAQLGFWPRPTEQELPLELILSRVKGLRCDSGAIHAYEILNRRIIGWLKHKTAEEKAQ